MHREKKSAFTFVNMMARQSSIPRGLKANPAEQRTGSASVSQLASVVCLTSIFGTSVACFGCCLLTKLPPDIQGFFFSPEFACLLSRFYFFSFFANGNKTPEKQYDAGSLETPIFRLFAILSRNSPIINQKHRTVHGQNKNNSHHNKVTNYLT